MDISIDEGFLNELGREISREPGVCGAALVGSHARGSGGRLSDIDLYRFVEHPPEDERQAYGLQIRAGRLVSLTTTTLAAQRQALRQPERAIFAAPGLRQARILFDREGGLSALAAEAQALTWEQLAPEAERYLSYNLMGLAEEAHKLIAGLALGDDARLLYATLGMFLGLAREAAVGARVWVESENSYFDQVQQAMGLDSAWSGYFRRAAGYAPATAAGRAEAGLRLYVESARRFETSIQAEDRAVIDHTLAAIREAIG